MKKTLFFIILLLPFFVFSQENTQGINEEKKEKVKKRPKVDGWSGATNYSKNEEPKYKGRISGRIKELKSKEPLEFATVSLKKFGKEEMVEGTITDEKGRFSFDEIIIGKYNVIISYMGFEETTILAEISKKNPNFKANNILLKQDSELLSEITIEDNKAIYETKIDKIVYNAENDLNDSENDATDVLRKAPLLSVDLEGNVSLRGSRNIKFLVNGKASSFFTSDISTALQMIPAEQIKTIEVITSPGAKYDGEGDAGIVNIITKKTIIDGYNATVNGMAGSKAVRTSLNLKIGKGKFGLSVRGGSFGSWPGRIGTHFYERSDWTDINENGEPINPNILTQEGTSESFYQGYRGSINTFYDVNSYNSFNSSISFRGRTKPSLVKDSIYYTNGEFPDSLSYTSYYSSEKTDRTLNLEWTTDYTKKFEDHEDKELTIAFQLGGDINDGNTDIDEGNINFFNENDERVLSETFQIDYVHPFGKSSNNDTQETIGNNQLRGYSKGGRKGKNAKKQSNSNKIEIGAKVINRDREIIYSDQRENIEISSEEFNYNQLVAASYLSSEFNLKHGIGIKTGVRYEYTQASGDWVNDPDREAFTTPYQDILPSIVISKSFSPMQSIKASYNQRITRPSVRQINTNNNKLDNRNITIGNPNLKPTVTEQYEIGMNSFGRVLQGSCQFYYKYSFNVIESFLDTIIDEVSQSTYRNIGESKQFGSSVFGSINLKKLSFRASFDIYNYSGKDVSLGYSDWTTPVMLYSYWIGGNCDLGNNWKAETFAFFRSPNQTIQGSSTSWSMMSLGIKKTFNKKRGSIGLRIIEPFQKTKEMRTDLEGEFFSQSNITTIPFRSFAISFKYTIGKLNFKDPKTKINNNDLIQEQNNDY